MKTNATSPAASLLHYTASTDPLAVTCVGKSLIDLASSRARVAGFINDELGIYAEHVEKYTRIDATRRRLD